MFNDINEAINWVTSRTKKEHQLSDFRMYLERCGNPQNKLKTIHVAGTNGKGSTTNFLRNILQTANYKVGSFTSPHLITHLDRIRVNNCNIDEEYFLKMCNEYYSIWEKEDLSMFEIDMFISINYFIEQKVDYAIYEVGLGGRLDATNVINPLISVITNIEMDHMDRLGDTIEKIAREKAGIIKVNTPLVTFEKKEEALNVFRKKAIETNSEIIFPKKYENVKISDHIEFDYQNDHYSIPTIANYQLLNATCAIETIDYLNNKGLVEVNKSQLIDGLKTSWAGRFEIINEKPKVIIDGAHNENGIDQLCVALDNIKEDYIIVFSALKDKNYHQMLEKLINKKHEVIVTQFDNYRRADVADLALGYDLLTFTDYNEAIDYALNTKKTVVVTGSLYFISIIRAMFVKE